MTTSFNKTYLLLGSLIVLAIVLGFWSYTRATGTTISACVSKNGDVRIPADGACRSNETPISWNVQGPKGDKGDQGAPGSNLHVFDANGQDLGLAIDADILSGQFKVYAPDAGAIFAFEERRVSGHGIVVSLDPSGSRGVYYDQTNCTGSPKLMGIEIQPGFGIATSSRFFVTANEYLSFSEFKSVLVDGVCINGTFQGPASGLKEVPTQFNLPLAWPLQIKSI